MITSSDFIVILPELILIGGAILLLMLDAFVPRVIREVGVLLAGIATASALMVLQLTDPQLPIAFGVLRNDMFTKFVGFLVLLSAFFVAMLSWGYLEKRGLPAAEYLVGLLVSAAGMVLISRSANLLMIFIALEMLSLSIYMMIGYHRANGDSVEAAVKYFILGAFASAVYIFGAVLVYGQTGSMDVFIQSGIHSTRLGTIGLVMLIAGLGFKISMAPFHLWTPDVYQGAPAPVAAFLSSGSKAAAFAAMLRIIYPAMAEVPDTWYLVWPWLAAGTMALGNLVALVQEDVKRILAYSSIAHVGFILMALTTGGLISAHAVLFYILTYVIATIGTFGVIAAMPGDERGRVDLHYIRGLSRSHPCLAALFALFILSLAGVPPLVGFAGKLVAFRAVLVGQFYALAIFGALNAAAAVYYYLRIIIRMYMEPRAEPLSFSVPQLVYPALAIVAAILVLIGVFPDSMLSMAGHSARALLSASLNMAGL